MVLGVQEVPDVLDRWTAGIPRERVHLVTVPPPGASPTLLWERFAGVFDLDARELMPTERANASLGVAESTMVRRLNTRLNNVLGGYGYRRFVRELVVHQHLARRRDSTRLSLPPEVHEWAASLSRSWVSELALRGYDVVGDLDDLIPTADPQAFVDPDTVDEHAVTESALDALAVLAIEASRLREVEKELHGVIEDLMGQLDAAHGTRSYKTKEKLVALAHRNVVARAGYSAYRRLRGRQLAVDVATDLPRREPVDAEADEAADDRGRVARPWSRAACRPPWSSARPPPRWPSACRGVHRPPGRWRSPSEFPASASA